ncbi:retrovirus-related pol polyprotein from transposon TNT 1-94 [Tanacetum coccineum]|uniref:Retrovirus-related pol polyprotein from transposon TNT 1-94 n=1 Tax=Tanacetum coccineum TaxID=301880 RepID=A0ABQ5CJF0_9ASTR
MAVTPTNKDKKARFIEPVTSSRNIITKTTTTSNLTSNKPMLSSTGVKQSTSTSGSQSLGNTKKDKIQQTPSSTLKNKHSKLNVNSKPLCVKCNGCKFSDNHDLCVLDFIKNVNARVKSKSVKKSSKRKVWKPTGKVFTNIGYTWRPTGRTFTIVGNACPLTRITITIEVPLRKLIALEIETPKPVVTLVYSRKPRKSKTNVPDSKSKVVQIVLWYLDSGCSKHMTGDRSQLTNFIGNVTISRVYYMEGLGHNLFSVRQFYDSNLEVAFRQNTCFTQALKDEVLSMHRRPVLSKLCENLGKLQPKADIGIFIGYAPTKKAFRIYNRRTRRIIETIHVDFDELTAMASEHSSSGPALHEMTPATISSGLVPNPPPSTPFVPPSRTDWDILFQPMFDELLTPPPSVDLPAPKVIALIDEVVAPVPAVSTRSPSSTTVDQDAPSPSNSQTTPETQPPVIPNDVEEDNHDIEVAHMGNDSYFGILILEIHSDQSSLSDSIHTIVHLDHQISKNNSKWTKDHPLENIIGELDRLVSTRLQLHEQALFCYYYAFLTVVEPKMYKDALTQSCWIRAMQEELNDFEHLEVWELVP